MVTPRALFFLHLKMQKDSTDQSKSWDSKWVILKILFFLRVY